jgi:hypothetical protein
VPKEVLVECSEVIGSDLHEGWDAKLRIAVFVLLNTAMVFAEKFNDSFEEVRSDVVYCLRRDVGEFFLTTLELGIECFAQALLYLFFQFLFDGLRQLLRQAPLLFSLTTGR